MTRFAALLVGLFAAATAFAQAYPSHPIKLIIPFPPGGGADTLARPLAERMRQRLGQPFVLENRTGASSTWSSRSSNGSAGSTTSACTRTSLTVRQPKSKPSTLPRASQLPLSHEEGNPRNPDSAEPGTAQPAC